VWPLERISNSGVLRVCRDAIELWASTHGGLALQRREALATAMAVPALEDAVARLYVVPGGVRRVDVVLESCWLPVMALRPSLRQRNTAALESLLRERLAPLYDSVADPVGRWALQVDGLPGEALALGYGLPARVRDGITHALHNAKVRALSLQPALARARAHESQRPAHRHSGWWLWQESDRALVMGLERGRCTSLHPASPPLQDGVDVSASAAAEAARASTSPGDSIIVGGWSEPRLPGRDVRWLGVAVATATVAARLATASAMPSAGERL